MVLVFSLACFVCGEIQALTPLVNLRAVRAKEMRMWPRCMEGLHIYVYIWVAKVGSFLLVSFSSSTVSLCSANYIRLPSSHSLVPPQTTIIIITITMQFHLLSFLAAAATVAAIPASAPTVATALSQSQDPAVHVDAIVPAIANLHIGTTQTSANIKTVSVVKINIDQCSACLGAVGDTISACGPVLASWSGWFHIPGCIKSIVNDFGVLVSC